MSDLNLGIIGGGQLGSLLSIAAKKLNIKTIVYSDDKDAPAHPARPSGFQKQSGRHTGQSGLARRAPQKNRWGWSQTRFTS